MRRTTVFSAACILCFAGPAVAQEWAEYVSTQDGFSINFPGDPTVEETTYLSGYNYTLPARVYSGTRGQERYSMTVVDYRGIEEMGRKRRVACPAGAETCQGQVGTQLEPVIGPAYATQDIRGAMLHASLTFIQRAAKLTDYRWNFTDLVENHYLQLTNADQSRTFVVISMHENRLYIQEGTVPAGYPEPGLFQQSLGWVDKDGKRIRYQAVYSNAFHGLRIYPVPPIYQGSRPDLDAIEPAPSIPAGNVR
jgi:hypothetical protein